MSRKFNRADAGVSERRLITAIRLPYDFSLPVLATNGSVFHLHVADTRAALNNYTASAAGGIERYSAASVGGKGRIIFYLVHARANICVHTRVSYAETHVQGYPPRSRSRRPVPDNRHQSSNDSPVHVTYVCTKSNGEKERRHRTPAILAGHTSPGSRFESNEGYILLASFYGWPEPESRCPFPSLSLFFFRSFIRVMRFLLFISLSSVINTYKARNSLIYCSLQQNKLSEASLEIL